MFTRGRSLMSALMLLCPHNQVRVPRNPESGPLLPWPLSRLKSSVWNGVCSSVVFPSSVALFSAILEVFTLELKQ